jgi:hypothetical protein
MTADLSIQYLDIIEKVAEDGELTYKEIYQLAKWLNDNKDGRQTWPASQFFPLLKSVLADGKIEKSEAQAVGQLIQKVRREWARENAITGAKPRTSTIEVALVNFDDRQPRLPSIETSLNVASFSEPDLVYEIDFSGPSCSCPDFKSYRQHLPAGHISRCCKHIMQGYSELRPKDGWPSCLTRSWRLGFDRIHGRSGWL